MVYFPNATAADIMDGQCADCRLPDDAPCPIMHVQLEHNYGQTGNEDLEDAMNKLIDENGKCMMKPLIDALRFDGKGEYLFRPPMVGDADPSVVESDNG